MEFTRLTKPTARVLRDFARSPGGYALLVVGVFVALVALKRLYPAQFFDFFEMFGRAGPPLLSAALGIFAIVAALTGRFGTGWTLVFSSVLVHILRD